MLMYIFKYVHVPPTKVSTPLNTSTWNISY